MKNDEKKSEKKAEKAEAKAEKAEKKKAKAEKAEKKKAKAEKAEKKKAEKKKAEKKKAEGKGAKAYARIPLSLLDEAPLGLRSASAIAHVGAGCALVVDDDEGIYVASADGEAELLLGREDVEALGDLESLCTSDDGKTAYVVAEESGEVIAMRVSRRGARVTLTSPRSLGKLPRPGKTANKGWEGASYLVGPSGPCLVVAHEREPMALAVYALPKLELVTMIPLDDTPLGALVDDVADVAVCPTTDHLFVLSDESHRIVETRLDVARGSIEVLGVFDLELRKKDKPEGIAFESKTTLVVVTDDPSRRLRFALSRRARQ